MTTHQTKPVSLTSTWFIRPGYEATVIPALERLALTVQETEPDTLMYLVHIPFDQKVLQSLPPSDPLEVLFVEMYASAEAFHAHVTGPSFTTFVKTYGDCFVSNGQDPPAPFTFVDFVERKAGFIRPAAVPRSSGSSSST